MRQRRVISLLSLAGLSLLHGCADSSAPSRATGDSGLQPASGQAVVSATHFEPLPAIDRVRDDLVTHNAPRYQRQPSYPRRFPPVSPVTERRHSIPAAPNAQRSFQRLPGLAHVAAVEPRTYAVDLSERTHPAQVPPALSLLPPIVPQRRMVEPEPAKPPLPPLTKQSAAAASGSSGWPLAGNSLVMVADRADGMIDRGFLLAEKGAYYSARTEFKQALRTVTQALDTHFGGNQHSEALAAGWLALEEADDFSAHSQRGPAVDVGLIVGTHQTKLLQDYALDDVSPVLAMQHYYAFAQEQLVQALGRAPVASRALFGLGKIHMVLGEKSSSAERLHGPKAMAFQQAALATDPGNFLAANELGVLLARFGKLHEARSVLQHAAAIRPLAETWQNLSVVHQRLGETDLATQSLANWQAARRPMSGPAPQQGTGGSMVEWVSPQAFTGQQPGGPTGPPSTAPATPREPPAQAERKSGFLWW